MSRPDLNPSAENLLSDLENSDLAPGLAAKIRALLTAGSDFDLHKINVFRLAEEWILERGEVLRGFLFATRLGLFDLNWDIHCPSCRGIPDFTSRLMGLKNRSHCALCKIDWDLDFADQVEVTFTVNPDVRKSDFVEFKDRDFDGMMDYFNQILDREKRQFTVGECIFPDRPLVTSADFLAGTYRVWIPGHLEGLELIEVAGEPAPDLAQELSVQVEPSGHPVLSTHCLRPGKTAVKVVSEYPTMDGFLIAPCRAHHNWVSAHHVTCQQDFRDLFAGEFLSPDCAFAIQAVTLLFTDLKSSTEMYEKAGDGRAFKKVRDHFEVMKIIIARHQGGIVKTIGDAVMAAFPRNADGVAAAVEIQQEFRRLRERGESDLELKIGLHRGPAIAVTSNRSLDYFGRTVNIAARVQGRSEASEILLSPAVFEDEQVAGYLANRHLESSTIQADLKGIAGSYTLAVLKP